MIPKVIHQIWIGPKQMPVEWMRTWNEKNPGSKVVFWDDLAIQDFWLKNKEKYDYYYTRGIYDGAADVARVEILERFGGVYVDADSVCLHPIENETFMEGDFFAAIEYDRRVGNGVIGAVANHPILQEYIKRIGEAKILEPACYTIGGTMLTSCIDVADKDGVTILPKYTFYSRIGAKYEGMVYARQKWGSTKKLYKI